MRPGFFGACEQEDRDATGPAELAGPADGALVRAAIGSRNLCLTGARAVKRPLLELTPEPLRLHTTSHETFTRWRGFETTRMKSALGRFA